MIVASGRRLIPIRPKINEDVFVTCRVCADEPRLFIRNDVDQHKRFSTGKKYRMEKKGQTHISLRPTDRTRAPLDRISTELEVAQRIWRLAPGNPEFLHRGISRLFDDRIEVSCGLALYQLAAGDLKLPSCDSLAEDGIRFGGVYL